MPKIILNENDYHYKVLTDNDLSTLLVIQDDAFLCLSNTETLRRNTKEMFLDCLTNHYVIGVLYNNKVIAFGILYFGRFSKENIGYDLDLKESNLLKVANVKLIIVQREYRGNKLQHHLIQKLEDFAKHEGIKTLASTISPMNVHSINNFQNCGFLFYKQTIKYKGLMRNIYYKHI